MDTNCDGDVLDRGTEDDTVGTDYVVIKLSSTGTPLWSKRLDGYMSFLSVDSSNNLVVAGSVSGAADLNGNGDALNGPAETTPWKL